MSQGNISNLSENIEGTHLIQFTAPISPGSSGGGLFDMDGNVIGITAASQNIPGGPQTGLAQNLNFAVPINSVKDVLKGGAANLLRESPQYYYSLGSIADNKKQWNDAIRFYRKAAAIDDTYADAYKGLAGDYYEKGNFDLEVANYLRATQVAPDDDYAFYYLGTAYEDTGEFDKAIVAYIKALEIDPNNKDALHDLSIVYLAEGKPDEARKLLPRLSALDKGYNNEIKALLQHVR